MIASIATVTSAAVKPSKREASMLFLAFPIVVGVLGPAKSGTSMLFEASH